jgi:hypothetical protein
MELPASGSLILPVMNAKQDNGKFAIGGKAEGTRKYRRAAHP